MSDTELPILRTTPERIPERVIVVGDPGRVDSLATKLKDPTLVSHNREYRFTVGGYGDAQVGVVSHGVGTAGASLCFEELCRNGAKRIIRVGTAGGMQPGVGAGDVVIATGAVREDGVTHKLVPASYPALVNAELLSALKAAADARGHAYRAGLVLTSDLFYPHDVLGSDLPLWQRAGVTAVEMECAALFVIASLHGVEAGGVVAIDGNPLELDGGSMEGYDPGTDTVKNTVDRAIDIALDAMVATPIRSA